MNRKIYGTVFSITNPYRVINSKNVLLVYICLHIFKGVSRIANLPEHDPYAIGKILPHKFRRPF